MKLITFKRTETGSWAVFVDKVMCGKTYKKSNGNWKAILHNGIDEGISLPGEFKSRKEAASELKIESAPDRLS